MTKEPTMNGALYANLTLADLIALVIDAVDATCQGCGGIWRAPFHYLPPTTRLHTLAGVLICPSCGGREVLVAPARSCGADFPH